MLSLSVLLILYSGDNSNGDDIQSLQVETYLPISVSEACLSFIMAALVIIF